MSDLMQSIENLFAGASAWGANLPQFLLVPLVMLLATVGTAVLVSLILGLIRLMFGQKAIDFIENIPRRLNAVADGAAGSQNKQ